MGFFSLLVMKIGKMLFGKLKELEVGIQWGGEHWTHDDDKSQHQLQKKQWRKPPVNATAWNPSGKELSKYLLNSQQYNI